MATKRDKTESREDWERNLTELLQSAEATIAKPTKEGIEKIRQSLNSFIECSPATKWWSTELDDKAAAALSLVHGGLLELTDRDLETRSVELRRIAKSVRGIILENKQIIADIQREETRKLLELVNNTARAAKELQAAVQDNPENRKISLGTVKLVQALEAFCAVAWDNSRER